MTRDCLRERRRMLYLTAAERFERRNKYAKRYYYACEQREDAVWPYNDTKDWFRPVVSVESESATRLWP